MRDLAVLRAMEAVPRTAFAAPCHTRLAFRDVALPAACGQSVPAPLLVARLLAGSRLQAGMRVLVVGTGAGYTTAVLSHLVAEVVSIDRFRSLVDAAAARFAGLGRANIETVWADGFEPPERPCFDRILIVAAVTSVPPRLWPLLKSGGALLHARPDGVEQHAAQALVLVERPVDGISKQTIIGPCHLAALRPGLAARL